MRHRDRLRRSRSHSNSIAGSTRESAVPHPDYVGNVRDSDPAFPCRVDYEVGVGNARGEWAKEVPAALDAFVRPVRYGLPPFVRIKPRPDDVLFSGAAQLSMRGDHRPTEAMFAAMLQEALRITTP